MRRALILALLALLVTAVGVHAGAPAIPAAAPADAHARATVARALALIDVRPQELGAVLRVTGPQDGVRADVDPETRVVTLHVRAEPAHRVAHDIAHELGHLVDHDRMTPPARQAWLRARGAAGRRWWPTGRLSDYATGAGDFAEAFARCHAPSPEFRSRLAPAPADACAMLDAVLDDVRGTR